MKRITPQEVLEAYEKTGLKPMQGNYFPEEGCACGLGILMYKNAEDEDKGRVWLDDIYGSSYRGGFANGFDLININTNLQSERAKQGYADGKACWDAVKHMAVNVQ